MSGNSALRPAVFGAMDGLVTSIAIVAGLTAASSGSIVAAGVAAAVAGACSMSLGEFASVEVHTEADGADIGTPKAAAGASFVSFIAGAMLPLLPYFAGVSSLALSATLAAFGLFGVGSAASRYTGRSVGFSGLRQVAYGAVAASATFVVGLLF